MQNHSEIAEFLWRIADLIKDDYDAKDYENVILPFTLLRRLDCVLQPTHKAVRDAAAKYRAVPEQTRDALLTRAAGQRFYNISEYSLAELLRRPNDLGTNFSAYLAGFSPNVKDILYNFSGGEEKGLAPIYETLLRKRLLFKVTQTFSEAPLDPGTVDNHGMGTIFEYLIRKFKEASNEAAGQFYTPRDIIRLMVRLMFEPDRAKLATEKLVGIYDPACGTGGMLTIAKEYLQAAINPELEVYLYGQELNEKTYAIAKADMLMKGEDPENIKRDNTLSHDLLPGRQFSYMLSNPPFGKDWKNIRETVEQEHALGAAGRYGPGLPDVGDGAMLFLLHKLSKMTSQGSKVAVIFNGSPLFNGDAGGGPSNIRKHILENDWLDAIVALPNDLFYNTGISTYIWLLDNHKPVARRGKVQLINANGADFYTMLPHNLGKKRVEISEDQAATILTIYQAFEENKVSKICETADFGYTKLCVERPLRLRYDLTLAQRDVLGLNSAMLKLKGERGEQLADTLGQLAAQAPWHNDARFFAALTKALPWKLTDGAVKTLRASLGVRDKMAETVLDGDGNPVPDSELRDFENVPLKEDTEAYFRREVLLHVPDAWMDRSKDKVGYEISFTKHFYEYKPLRSTAQIAAELSALDTDIENLVREKTLMRQTVSKGLDPSVPMKDSGLPWLGAIPQHWEVIRAKFVARLESGHTPSRQRPEWWENCTIPWVSLADVGQFRTGQLERIYETAENVSELGLANSSARLLPAGTVLLSRTASVGFSVIAGVPLATTQDFVNWICGPRLLPEYLLYVLRSMQQEFKRLTSGSTHQTIYMPDVADFVIPLPPIEEQQAVYDHIKNMLPRIDAAIDASVRRIDVLGEYRAALAHELINGQGAASSPPLIISEAA